MAQHDGSVGHGKVDGKATLVPDSNSKQECSTETGAQKEERLWQTGASQDAIGHAQYDQCVHTVNDVCKIQYRPMLSSSMIEDSSLQRALGVELIEGDFRAYQTCYQACSMTIQWSMAQRERNMILEGLSTREEDSLRSLVRLCVLYPLGAAKTSKGLKDSSLKYLRANALYLLSIIFLNDQEKSFHQLDALTTMIIMTTAVPTLTGNGKLEVGKQVKPE